MNTTTPAPQTIAEAHQRITKLLSMTPGETHIDPISPGSAIVVSLGRARAVIKPTIGCHRVEFRSPDNQIGWEIGCAYSEMPGAVIAGLELLNRIPFPSSITITDYHGSQSTFITGQSLHHVDDDGAIHHGTLTAIIKDPGSGPVFHIHFSDGEEGYELPTTCY